jgi:hypothetical protein
VHHSRLQRAPHRTAPPRLHATYPPTTILAQHLAPTPPACWHRAPSAGHADPWARCCSRQPSSRWSRSCCPCRSGAAQARWCPAPTPAPRSCHPASSQPPGPPLPKTALSLSDGPANAAQGLDCAAAAAVGRCTPRLVGCWTAAATPRAAHLRTRLARMPGSRLQACRGPCQAMSAAHMLVKWH